jgi:5-methylcytosine-specific restriction endonuclease McrA
VLERDGHRRTNPDCRSTQNLDVHHIIPKARWLNLALDLDNLNTLCEKCHVLQHRTGVLNSRTIHPESPEDATES